MLSKAFVGTPRSSLDGREHAIERFWTNPNRKSSALTQHYFSLPPHALVVTGDLDSCSQLIFTPFDIRASAFSEIYPSPVLSIFLVVS
jgi:hypothetical protein